MNIALTGSSGLNRVKTFTRPPRHEAMRFCAYLHHLDPLTRDNILSVRGNADQKKCNFNADFIIHYGINEFKFRQSQKYHFRD